MSETTVATATEDEAVNVETVETVENADAVNADKVAETAETVEVAEPADTRTPAEIASEAYAAIADDNPVKNLIPVYRTIMETSIAGINANVEKVQTGKNDLEQQISDAIEDSEDAVIVAARDSIDELLAEAERQTAELRASIAEAKGIVLMSDEDEKALRAEIDKATKFYRASEQSTLKMLCNVMDEADAKALFADLGSPKSLSKGGKAGSTEPKPRLAEATLTHNGTEYVIAGSRTGKEGTFPTFGDIAVKVNTLSGIKVADDKVKGSDISAVALSNGLDENGEATFTYVSEVKPDKFTVSVKSR